MKLSTKVLIGLVAGVVVGLLMGNFVDVANTWIKPIGALFLNLIKMIIVPLVLASLVTGVSSLGDMKKLGRMGGKTVLYYLCTTAIAASIGLIIGNIMKPGSGLNLQAPAEFTTKEIPSIASVLVNIVPSNPINAMVQANMLQIIVFALFIGIAITAVGKKAVVVKNFFEGFAEIMYKVTGWVMEFAPYGVFALIAPVVAANGPSVLLPLLKIILAVYIACLIHIVIVYSFAVSKLGGYSSREFFKGILPAQLVAFSTCSSAGTLPVTMHSVEKNLGVSKSVSSFVLPLGATINMDGTAIYEGIAALFVAQLFGIDLSISQQIIIVLIATMASIGAAGVPGAGIVMLTMVLTAIGLPMEGIALVAGIDRILDMARTCTNVTGDATASVVVAASESELGKAEAVSSESASV